MSTITKTVHVSVLLRQPRGLRDGFVKVTVEDAASPSDADRLAHLREEIALSDLDVSEGRVSPASEVFARLRAPEHDGD